MSPGRKVRAGDPAGYRGGNGYWRFCFKRRNYQAHQIVLELSGQPCPGKGYECDHRDHDRGNNRVENLRWVTAGTNLLRKRMPLARSGWKYVRLMKGCKDRYQYDFRVNGTTWSKGGYTTPTEAHTAALAHRLELFWNP